MNVLSLFDGMSCGQIALQRANIDYCNYFASEINKQSINQYNTTQLPKYNTNRRCAKSEL